MIEYIKPELWASTGGLIGLVILALFVLLGFVLLGVKGELQEIPLIIEKAKSEIIGMMYEAELLQERRKKPRD